MFRKKIQRRGKEEKNILRRRSIKKETWKKGLNIRFVSGTRGKIRPNGGKREKSNQCVKEGEGKEKIWEKGEIPLSMLGHQEEMGKTYDSGICKTESRNVEGEGRKGNPRGKFSRQIQNHTKVSWRGGELST